MLRTPPSSTFFPFTTLFRSIVLLDQGHLSVHALPERQALLFDAVAPASHDFRKALDVLSKVVRSRQIGKAHVELQSPVHIVCRLLLQKTNISARYPPQCDPT